VEPVQNCDDHAPGTELVENVTAALPDERGGMGRRERDSTRQMIRSMVILGGKDSSFQFTARNPTERQWPLCTWSAILDLLRLLASDSSKQAYLHRKPFFSIVPSDPLLT